MNDYREIIQVTGGEILVNGFKTLHGVGAGLKPAPTGDLFRRRAAIPPLIKRRRGL